jgi:hypothetical protein
MADYQPLDISGSCNAGAAVLGEAPEVAVGRQTFRGLPFLIGSHDGASGDRCFISFGESNESVTVPINETAQRIVVAHRLLETKVPAGGPLGIEVAEYVFHYAGGGEERVAIRERFEIAAIPGAKDIPGVPGLPYRAATDQKAELLPVREGEWEQAGRRQTEAHQALARNYFLWAFRNPHPERTIASLEIVPGGPVFIIAAITLGHVNEHPFARQGRRAAKITLTGPEDARKPFDLEVEVDRGDATYVHPLPATATEGFLADSFKGYGQEQNTGSSPAYAEVSAVPSATLTVKQDGAAIGEVNWGEVEEKGAVETPRMRIELIDPGKNWVNVTVVDDDTGRPVPCRVHFRSPDGVPYQPHGHHNQVNSNLDTWHIDVGGDVRLGQTTYAYIDGACQGWLPRGEVVVDVARGFEYQPLRTTVNIEPGQRELTLRIKRWIDMNERRWYSGDSHVHFLSTQGAHTESMGEDLNVVNLLQSQWGSLFTNTEDFTGAASVSRAGDNIVYVSQENRQHFLGHMILWGLKKPVMPWCSDGLGEAEIGGTMETTLSYWADEAHAQGGYVISPHFPNPNGEPAALVATGRLDGVEMIRGTQINHDDYYRYLNCGYRLPLVGGTDKMSSDVPVGLYRTYVRLRDDEEFSYDNWCKNVVRGRTFLSGGPIIHLSVDGREVGDTVRLSGPGTVEVEAWAESVLPINTLQIVQAGRVVASAESRDGTRRLELKEKLKVDGHTWISARCGGPNYLDRVHLDVWRRSVFAHTSPIYVACDGDWEMFDEATARYMLTLIEGDLAYVREGSGQHKAGTVTHHHGEDDHIAYLERPFIEARAAIHQRMHKLGLSH